MHFLADLLGLYVEPRDLSAIQVSARGLLVFVSALVMLRVAHKRFFAQRNALDVLLSLVIASTLSRAINGDAALFPTIVVGFVLVFVHRGVVRAASRWESIDLLMKGSSVLLIENGRLDTRSLQQHALSKRDIDEDLRLNGVESAEGVKVARLERNGEMSVVKAGPETG